MKAMIRSQIGLQFGMKDSQQLPSRSHGRVQSADHRGNQAFRKIIERSPKQHDVEYSAGEVQILPGKPLHIPNRLAILVRTGEPFRGRSVLDQIGHVHAMAQAREVVDIGRRSRADIQDAQSLLAREPLTQRAPAAGMAHNPGPAGACRPGGLLPIKQLA